MPSIPPSIWPRWCRRSPIIATRFIKQLLARLEGAHAERLKREAAALKQPFGGVRQHFNHYLAQRRAEQLQHVHLAQLFTRMGYVEAARRQVRVVPVAAARMLCDMQCRLTTAHREIDQGRLEPVVILLSEIENILHRAIECGAMVDPWNILGFGGQFSLFPSPENSIHDYRIDELLNLMSDIFALYIRTGKEAAALGNNAVQTVLADQLKRLTEWWDKFATTEVSEVGGISGRDTFESAEQVASALRAWHEAGAAAGRYRFLAQARRAVPHGQILRPGRRHLAGSRRSGGRPGLVGPLAQPGRHDPLGRGKLFLQRIGRAVDGRPLAIGAGRAKRDRGIIILLHASDGLMRENFSTTWRPTPASFGTCRTWKPLPKARAGEMNEEEEEEPDDETDNLFSAAYEQLTYRDSTDDGMDSSLFETGPDAAESELVFEAERIVGHLAFLAMVAHLWKMTATVSLSGDASDPQRDEVLAGWHDQAAANYRELLELLAAVHRYRIPAPSGSHDSMVEYDRRRSVKEMLLENIINTCVDTADTMRMIRAAMNRHMAVADAQQWEEPMHRVLSAVLRGEAANVRKNWKELLDRA